MIINVDKLPEEGLKISKDFEFFMTELVEDRATFIRPVHADITVYKVGEEVFVKGHITSLLNMVCSRCLVSFEYPVDANFDLVFLPEELNVAKEQLERDDMNKVFYYSRIIDLKKEILEQLNLSLPIKPLCSKDCQGICPVCGKIVKDGNCSCHTNESDPRLDKLKTFLRDKN